MAILEHVEHVLAAVAATRGADLPEPLVGHPLEIRARRAELRPMEDRLAASQLLKDFTQPGIGRQPRFHARPPSAPGLTLPYPASTGAARPLPLESATRR